MDDAMKNMLSMVAKRMPIPGLSVETLVPVFVQEEFSDKISAIEDPTERAEFQQGLIDYYLSGNGRKSLEGIISSMEHYYYVAFTVLTKASAAVSVLPTMLALPAVTPGATNPAWTALQNQLFKSSLQAQALYGKDAIAGLLEKALLVHFDVTAIATPLVTMADTVESLISI